MGSSDLDMALYPKEITMYGHRLKRMEKPAKHRYRCKGCKERDVRPCYKYEDERHSIHLHKECYNPCQTSSIKFNLSGSKFDCEFVFHEEALGGKGVCDACGDDVKGWFYKCKICEKPHYLHPCCAKLPIKKSVETAAKGEIVIDLKATSSSKCLICGHKENSDEFSGRYYISRCGEYCYHWSCMKNMAVNKWKRRTTTRTSSQALKTMPSKTVTIQHPSHGKDYDTGKNTGKRSAALPKRAKEIDEKPHKDTKSQAMQPSQDTKKRPRPKGVIAYAAEVAVELLNIFIPLIFGLPPLPLGLLLALPKALHQ